MQQQNPELMKYISTRYQKRWEPNFAWVNAVGVHLMLPHLRGFWNYGPISLGTDPLDLSGHGHTLSNTGGVPFDVYPGKLVSVANFNSALSQGLSHVTVPELEITDEITAGGWFYLTAMPGASVEWRLMGKHGASPDWGWRIYVLPDSLVWASVSPDGFSQIVGSGPFAIGINRWYHIVLRLIPSVEQSVWINGIKGLENYVGPSTGIFNSTAPFEIGMGDGDNFGDDYAFSDAYSTLNFVCADALPDVMIESVFWQTCAMFGVKPLSQI